MVGRDRIMDPDDDARLTSIEEKLTQLQQTIAEILTKVDTVVDNVAPLVKQVEESPLFRMLGGNSDRKERRRRRDTVDSA